jgi:HPt (histidine-containing phosphotransfer) domain-containing protein
LFLDKDHLLESAGDWEFAAELLVDMLTELGTSLPAIEDVAFAGGNCDSTLDVSQPSSIVAIAAAEATTLAKAAHGVKGAALNLGLQQLAKSALGVELIGKALADRKVGESPGATWCGADQGTLATDTKLLLTLCPTRILASLQFFSFLTCIFS